jgi:CheY-like chemotaxis protein
VISILVIDDDAQMRAFARKVLEPVGYEVREASNGAEGLKAQRQRPFDLIICDIFMPEKEDDPGVALSFSPGEHRGVKRTQP